jgi:hypothetical protein
MFQTQNQSLACLDSETARTTLGNPETTLLLPAHRNFKFSPQPDIFSANGACRNVYSLAT